MTPHRIALTNFLRFGEGPNQSPGADIAFEDGEPLYVLNGANGVGKSAVFDAITYALFGCHRGGKGQGMDDLIRHGSNGFTVDFHFTFGGHRYRIQRSHGRKAVERVWKDGVEVDVPSVRNKVRAWVEGELGLTHEQFTASVLLKQGEADRIITAGGKERLEMLKQIIGVKPYEELSKRVHTAAAGANGERERLARDLAAVDPVTSEELAAAEAAFGVAETAWTTARDSELAAATGVEQAKRFAELERTRAELDGRMTAAADRRAEAAGIRARHARLTDLEKVLPTLTSLLAARTDREKAEPERDRLRAEDARLADEIAAAEAERDAARADAEGHRRAADEAAERVKEMQREQKDAEAKRKIAAQVAEIDAKLAALPPDLRDLLTAAKQARDSADSAHTRAVVRRSAAETERKRWKTELDAFADVGVGVKCSRCGNDVTAEHAAAERKRMMDEFDKATAEWQATTDDETKAATRAEEARRQHDKSDGDARTADKLESTRLGLLRHGSIPTVAEFDERIRTLAGRIDADTETERAGRDAAKVSGDRDRAAENRRATAEKDRKAGQVALTAAEGRLTTAVARLGTLEGQLPGDWIAEGNSLTADRLSGLDRERAELARTDVVEQHRQLEQDGSLRDEWERQRQAALDGIAELPADARVPVADAEARARAARQEVERTADARDAARRERDEKAARAVLHAKLSAEARAAEAAADRLERLDDLLGAAGLLRELVRTAERQIVRFANETVRNLSAGELAIELDDAEDGPDKAFTLRVRRAEHPKTIDVAFLSGSQKFRVAVAVALAIGRFATTGARARPLESVIIDEGFGSLDQDGLRCMADELNRLRDHTGLKRIILVSHQEEFAGRFPVGWHLSAGEDGTTVARPYRR